MKNLNIAAALVLSASIITSCSGVRKASSASGSVTPASGDASSISSGRNTTGTPITDSVMTEKQNAPGVAAGVEDESVAIPAKDKPELFFKQMSASNAANTQVTKMALQRAQNPYVKALSAVVLKDSQDANAALQKLAASKSIAMDSLTLNKDGDNKVRELSSITGEEFETVFLRILTQGQEQQIRLYEAAGSSTDKELKAYANQYLPLLRSHLKSIAAMNAK
jgi:putative membrane protein